MAKTIGASEIKSYELGKIDALTAIGLSNEEIARVINRSVSSVKKHVSLMKADAEADTAAILRSIDPVAAVVMAESMASTDEHVKLKAATVHLKGRGHYSEHVQQTTRAIPDSEIVAGMAELLIDALAVDAQDAEYTVSDPNSTAPEQRSATISDSPDIVHGSATATKEGRNSAEAAAKAPPMNTEDRVKQVRNSGETMGKLLARENAKRWTANAPTESNTGATDAQPDAQDERP